MIYHHFSRQPIDELRDIPQLGDILGDKPSGLWISPPGDDSWESWCRSDYPDGLAQLKYEVELARDANVLRVSGYQELEDFNAAWGAMKQFTSSSNFRIATIRWKELAEVYDGVIIAPYSWLHRLAQHTRWYYGWDCASGCIWRGRAIARIEPVNEAAAA